MKKTILTAAALIALSTTAQAETFKSYEECVMARGESWVQVRIEWGGCDIIAKAGTPLPKAQPKVEVAKVEPKPKVEVAKEQPKAKVQQKVDNSLAEEKTKKWMGTAWMACSQWVRSQAKYPSEVDFNWIDGNDQRYWLNFSEGKSRVLINRAGKMMNGLGMMVPFKATCKWDYDPATGKAKAVEAFIS